MRSKGHGADCGKTLYQRLRPSVMHWRRVTTGHLLGWQAWGPTLPTALPSPKPCVPTWGICRSGGAHMRDFLTGIATAARFDSSVTHNRRVSIVFCIQIPLPNRRGFPRNSGEPGADQWSHYFMVGAGRSPPERRRDNRMGKPEEKAGRDCALSAVPVCYAYSGGAPTS